MSRRNIKLFRLLSLIFTKQEQARLYRVQIWSLLNGICQGVSLFLVIPVCVTLFQEKVFLGFQFQTWILILGFFALISGILSYYASSFSYHTTLDLLDALYINIGNHIAKMPIGAFQKGDSGKYSRLVSQELMNVGQYIAHGLPQLVVSSASLIVTMLCILFWKKELGLMFLLGTICTFLLVAIGNWIKKIKMLEVERTEEESAIRIFEYTKCQGILRATNRSQHYEPLEKSLRNVNRVRIITLFFETLAIMIQGFASINVPLAISVYAWNMVLHNHLGISTFLVLVCLSFRLSILIDNIVVSNTMLQSSQGILNSLSVVLTSKCLQEPDVSKKIIQNKAISFEHVYFSYIENYPILTDFNLEIQPGQMCAVVGPSGCGKTTLARLIARFYDVDKGVIKVKGVNVRDLTTADLMRQISIVFQDVYLFDDTLRNNLLIANPNATDEELEKAAQLSGVSEMLKRLPDGWNTIAGEGGHALSGGERQRVSIARALLKQAPIVLLDEATSALDAENEKHIVASIQELKKSSTLFVIAHKLETIQSADVIVVLDKSGNIIQKGKHDILMKEEGEYRQFWTNRLNAKGWTIQNT